MIDLKSALIASLKDANTHNPKFMKECLFLNENLEIDVTLDNEGRYKTFSFTNKINNITSMDIFVLDAIVDELDEYDICDLDKLTSSLDEKNNVLTYIFKGD